MATNIDAKKYNQIVEDVISNISKTSITDNDLDSVKFKIKKKINKKNYTFSELTIVVDKLKSQIVKVKFSKSDIRGAANKARSKILQLSNALGGLDDLKGLTMKEKAKVILKLIFRTLIRLLDDILLLFVSICIVLNLYFRSNVPSSLLYPSNGNEFPYVYFNENDRSKQSTLTSCIEINAKDIEDDVFLDTPAYFTNDGKYVLDKNICQINDPFGISEKGDKSKCRVKVDDIEFAKFFGKSINYNNLSFFAKRFMENNTMKKSDELSLYGMLTYVMLFSTINSNSYISGISDLVKGVLPYKGGKSIMYQLLFYMIVMIFYALFQTNKFGFSRFFNKLLPRNGKMNIVNSFINIFSGLFSPFITFFKLNLLLIYPLVLFSSIFAFVNFSSYVSGWFTKLFAFFGIAYNMLNLLVYIMMILNLFTKRGSKLSKLDDIFDGLIKDFVKTIKKSIKELKRILGGKKRRQGSLPDVRGGKTSKASEKTSKGKGGAKGPSFNCAEPSIGGFTLTALIGMLLTLIFGPIMIILFMLPFIISLPMTFSMSKGMGLDFMKYIKKIFCMMGDYKLVIRFIFYTIMIYEITKYMKRKFAIITAGTVIVIILMDLMQDYIKKIMNKSGCNVEENGLNVGEKVSEFLMTKNNNVK